MKTFHLIMVMTLLLLGCSSQSEKTITVLGENSSNLQAMIALKSSYENENNVLIVFKPNSFEDAFTKSNQDFSNQTGLYDIVLQYNFSLSSYVRNDYVYNLNDLKNSIPDSLFGFESNLFQNAWKEVGFYYSDYNSPEKGILEIGYPFAINTMVLVYNKDFFDDDDLKVKFKNKYGKVLAVPKDWESYRNLAEFFTSKDSKSGQQNYGICLQGAPNGWLYYEFCNFLFSIGDGVTKKSFGWETNRGKELLIANDNSIKALEFYLSLKPFNAGNFLTIDQNEQLKLLKQGNIAMAFVWSDYLPMLLESENSLNSTQFGFSPIPGNVSGIAGGSFYINKQSKHPYESLRYIISLLQESNQIELVKNGLCSPLKSIYEDSALDDIPYIDALGQSISRGIYMYEAGIDADIINQSLTKYVQMAWQSELDPSEALKLAKREIEKEQKKMLNNL